MDTSLSEKKVDYATLADLTQLPGGKPHSTTPGGGATASNLLTVPWWWQLVSDQERNSNFATRLLILISTVFLAGAEFTCGLFSGSRAILADATCDLVEIFTHFVSLYPELFPEAENHHRNQMVMSGIAVFVHIAAIMVFLVASIEDVYYEADRTIGEIYVVVFGVIGVVMNLGGQATFYHLFRGRDRKGGPGTYITLDLFRAVALCVDGSILMATDWPQATVDSWTTIAICIVQFWAGLNECRHWNRFATPFTGGSILGTSARGSQNGDNMSVAATAATTQAPGGDRKVGRGNSNRASTIPEEPETVSSPPDSGPRRPSQP